MWRKDSKHYEINIKKSMKIEMIQYISQFSVKHVCVIVCVCVYSSITIIFVLCHHWYSYLVSSVNTQWTYIRIHIQISSLQRNNLKLNPHSLTKGSFIRTDKNQAALVDLLLRGTYYTYRYILFDGLSLQISIDWLILIKTHMLKYRIGNRRRS